MLVYVPSDDCACVSITNGNYLRCYSSQPRQNSTINYTDYYFNSHYMEVNGSQTFSNYSTLPTCINSSNLTNNVMYRNDLDSILLCFFIILLICFYFPYRMISRLFGRWLKW